MTTKRLADWLNYYENLHPVGIDMGLERVGAVWEKLCDAYQIDCIAKKKVITVAGTNGKGSACQMLSSLLIAQGHCVGMFTSPHIHRFNEQIKINHREAADCLIIQAFEAIEATRGELTLSYFEAATLAGLLVFAWQTVDFAVLEVGLGGRLDAVNIIDADAVLITSIARDHEAFLGSDLALIALEKMGVCRANKPAVYAQADVFPEVVHYARQQNTPLFIRDSDYFLENDDLKFRHRSYELPERLKQLGQHQVNNAAGVIVLLTLLDLLPCDYRSILADFAVAGRLQKIAAKPDIFVDVAHNEAAAEALAAYLQKHQTKYQRIFAVVGMLNDKEHTKVLTVFNGVFDAVYCGSTHGERGFSDEALADCAKKVLTVPVHACGELEQALVAAKAVATKDDLLIAFGSFLVVEALSPRK